MTDTSCVDCGADKQCARCFDHNQSCCRCAGGKYCNLDNGNPRGVESFNAIIQAVKDIKQMSPDLRFGQIIKNIICSINQDPELFYIEDGPLRDAAQNYKEKKQ